jgi:hypothetical protein
VQPQDKASSRDYLSVTATYHDAAHELLLASDDCDVAVDIPISANVQSAHSNDFAVLGVAACPKIQSPQLNFAGQADSTDGCGVEPLVPASKRKNQFRRGLLQALLSLGLFPVRASRLSNLNVFIVGLSFIAIAIMVGTGYFLGAAWSGLPENNY